MTDRERLIKARLGILVLARELRNVAKTCKLIGLSRSQFYAMRKAFDKYGEAGLSPKIRRKPQMPNRTPGVIEEKIILKTQENPFGSYLRLAEQMKKDGIGVTPAMVRYVWRRHGLSTETARLQWVRRRKRAGRIRSKDEMGPGAKCIPHSDYAIKRRIILTGTPEQVKNSSTE
jgi:hypothetical protein